MFQCGKFEDSNPFVNLESELNAGGEYFTICSFIIVIQHHITPYILPKCPYGASEQNLSRLTSKKISSTQQINIFAKAHIGACTCTCLVLHKHAFGLQKSK